MSLRSRLSFLQEPPYIAAGIWAVNKVGLAELQSAGILHRLGAVMLGEH